MPQSLQCFLHKEDLFAALAQRIAGLLCEGGSCVLPGGTTPIPLCHLLGEMRLPWERIVFLPTDERCVLPHDPAHNGTALRKALGDRGYRFVDFPASNDAATLEAFTQCLRPLLPFRAVVLGLGEDGHTASLFPNHSALAAEGLVVAVTNAPKPPANRLSLSLSALKNTAYSFVIATGRGKAEAVRALAAGEPIPALQALGATAEIFLDEEAASLLPKQY